MLMLMTVNEYEVDRHFEGAIAGAITSAPLWRALITLAASMVLKVCGVSSHHKTQRLANVVSAVVATWVCAVQVLAWQCVFLEVVTADHLSAVLFFNDHRDGLDLWKGFREGTGWLGERRWMLSEHI